MRPWSELGYSATETNTFVCNDWMIKNFSPLKDVLVSQVFNTEFESSLNISDSKIKFTKTEILINNIKTEPAYETASYLTSSNKL